MTFPLLLLVSCCYGPAAARGRWLAADAQPLRFGSTALRFPSCSSLGHSPPAVSEANAGAMAAPSGVRRRLCGRSVGRSCERFVKRYGELAMEEGFGTSPLPRPCRERGQKANEATNQAWACWQPDDRRRISPKRRICRATVAHTKYKELRRKPIAKKERERE